MSAVGSLFGNFSYEIPSAYPYLYQREGVGRDAGAPLGAARALPGRSTSCMTRTVQRRQAARTLEDFPDHWFRA